MELFLQVKVMTSIRRPKRLIIRGDDERDHPVLVKSGEDLRQDQRIQQLFSVMNILLSNDAACAQRGLRLRTYQVVPLTSRWGRGQWEWAGLQPRCTLTKPALSNRIGLIEWMENTCTLKEFLGTSMTAEEQRTVAGYVHVWLVQGNNYEKWSLLTSSEAPSNGTPPPRPAA